MTYVILYYGSILDDKEDWKFIEAPISDIKSIRASVSGNYKIEINWKYPDKYDQILFNLMEVL